MFRYLKDDLPASLVVYLVALPLCLGIALSSGTPLISGIISGVIGGILIGSISHSQVSVSGPAAGLIIIVVQYIALLGSFNNFLVALAIAGLLQFGLGLLKAGTIKNFFPFSVIKGMLAAIGFILILKQIPHALGYDMNFEGDESFLQKDGHNSISEIYYAAANLNTGALLITLVCMGMLMLPELGPIKRFGLFRLIPVAFFTVVAGSLLNRAYLQYRPDAYLSGNHMVQLPVPLEGSNYLSMLEFPDWSAILNYQTWLCGAAIAIVSSLESLLSLEASDKLDPHRRKSSPNRELQAQGIGNFLSGLVGGLPITAVIVRSSTNILAGARTRLSAIMHGVILLLSVLYIPHIINLIPKSALAAVLILVGYKLTKPALFREMWLKGQYQFVPFVITFGAILFSDLLIGIAVGMVVAILYILKANFRNAVIMISDGSSYMIRLGENVSYLNKAVLIGKLNIIPDNSTLLIDGTQSKFIDSDIYDTLEDFMLESTERGIVVNLKRTMGSRNPYFRSHSTEETENHFSNEIVREATS